MRHRTTCSIETGRCNCRPGYQAAVWSRADNKPIRKTFSNLAEAKAWRQETQVALRKGTVKAPSPTTFAQAAQDWLTKAQAGTIRTRAGTPYKPSALRGYESVLRSQLIPAIGDQRLTQISREMLQELIEGWIGAGKAAATVHNYLLPAQAIFRRAKRRSEVAQNPTVGLERPRERSKRPEVAPPARAEALIDALPAHLQALWATAVYAGLRRGELQGLRWLDVDFEAGVISVSRSWDEIAGPIAPKSRAGERRVPIAPTLRRYLLAHRLRESGDEEASVFPSESGHPFWTHAMMRTARSAWQEAGLQPITLHECRHACASFMIAAGVNAKALSVYLGHSSITVTIDRYGHLLPGNEKQAAALLERFLETTRATAQQSAS